MENKILNKKIRRAKKKRKNIGLSNYEAKLFLALQKIYLTNRQVFNALLILMKQLSKETFLLLRYTTNTALIKFHLEKILKILKQLEQKTKSTKLYVFVKQDLDKAKGRVSAILKNPKDIKPIEIFALIYILLPFTFWITISYLVIRYSTKYIKKKYGNHKKRYITKAKNS